MAEHGIRDFQMAKEKAVVRLGLVGRRGGLPTNREIDAALSARLRLFDARALGQRNRALLQAAEQTMELLAAFDPRLVGALLRGTVTERTPVELHLFAETPDAVSIALTAHGIRYQSFDKRVRFARKRYALVPSMRFDVDDEPVEVMSFEARAIREAPLCPVEGRPMRRVSLAMVKELLRQQSAA